MKDFTEGLSWLVGVILLVSISWVLVGVVARVIRTLFCWGYGCS